MKRFFEESLLTKSIRFGLFASLPLLALMGCSGDDGKQGEQGESGKPSTVAGPQGEQGSQGERGFSGNRLIRLATVPMGAEVTGAHVTENGDLFFNVQHPSDTLNIINQKNSDKPINKGTVGVVEGLNIHKLPTDLISVKLAEDEDKQTVQMAYGEYKILGQYGDNFVGGNIENSDAGEDNKGIKTGFGVVLASDGKTPVTVRDTDNPDFNGFVKTKEDGSEGYLFTNWESIPGGMSRIKLKKGGTTWSVDNTDVMMLDFGKDGTMANCFGSVSPWGTPLTSEEWGNKGDKTFEWNKSSSFGDADSKNRKRLAGVQQYLKPTASDEEQGKVLPNTYRYHYIVEITDALEKAPKPVKRYAMGRYEHENAIVMPDEKTVYLSQDNEPGAFFKFVADDAKDLSSGTLYAAKLKQDEGINEPSITGFDITWIELAHGNEEDIAKWIAEYDSLTFEKYEDGYSNYLTDADAIAWAEGDAKYPAAKVEYAAAKAKGFEGAEAHAGLTTAGKDMDNRVAFLESRKAARAKGATVEFRKFEGININQKRAKEAVSGDDMVANEVVRDAYVYFGIAGMGSAMMDDKGDIQLNDRVGRCGGVYRMRLTTEGEATDTNPAYNVTRIEPVVMANTIEILSDNVKDYRCDADYIVEPDNVVVLEDGRILIGEDASNPSKASRADKFNNALWLYDPR